MLRFSFELCKLQVILKLMTVFAEHVNLHSETADQHVYRIHVIPDAKSHH